MNVLIAYGSKHGSTKEIAELVATAFRQEDLQVLVCAAGDVRDLNGYDAVVLGGALYFGRWHREARHLARRLQSALRERPVWLFSSGPLDQSASDKEVPPVGGVAKIARQVQARGHVTFGGKLAETTTGFVASSLVRRGMAGDYRNREQITAWAHTVAAQLKSATMPQAF